jgi:hypothetical protein
MQIHHEFSSQELEFAQNPTYILIKRRVMEKMESYLYRLYDEYRIHFSEHLNDQYNFRVSTPKVNRGENYREMPYLIIDYPAHFSNNHIFACRSMFLWGNHLSITIHLQGKYHRLLFQRIIDAVENHPDLKAQLFFCVNDTPWEYHYQDYNYVPYSSVTKAVIRDRFANHHFSKFSIKSSMDEIEGASERFVNFFRAVFENL